MAKLQLSAFSDEYADSFSDQLEAMNRLEIDYIELRFVDKKNVAELTATEVKQTADMLRAAGAAATACESVEDGVRSAREKAGPEGVVLCFGSLYTIGSIQSALA